MATHTYTWRRGYGRPDVEIPYEQTVSDWDREFPRFHVRYGGWLCSRSAGPSFTDEVPERAIAEAQMAVLLAESADTESSYGGITDMWAEVRDIGSAPYPQFRTGSTFYARDGREGFIYMRRRDSASVQWNEDGRWPVDPFAYPLDAMLNSPPEPTLVPYSMGWLRGR
ncbi:hypothetical protein [Actinacidiphila glaucinigra]|uniref:hypothetical protein n=1 Tax=Actinacidiphila glaucinigra TaxID=235986 RepID=UPI003D948AA9